MKIALFGYGKMGRLLEKEAQARGHEVIVRFSNSLGSPLERKEEVKKADIAIDFTEASSVISHLDLCLSLGKPLVIGTTGWEDQLSEAKLKVAEKGGSCLYSANFSIGILLFKRMISFAASQIQMFKEYDVAGIEYHHRQKKDQPSGTAKALKEEILRQMPHLEDVSFSSVRIGHMPGTHLIHFDSKEDTITLKHEARNKEGFAKGALLAAEWLLPKKGFFTMDHLMKEIL